MSAVRLHCFAEVVQYSAVVLNRNQNRIHDCGQRTVRDMIIMCMIMDGNSAQNTSSKMPENFNFRENAEER